MKKLFYVLSILFLFVLSSTISYSQTVLQVIADTAHNVRVDMASDMLIMKNSIMNDTNTKIVTRTYMSNFASGELANYSTISAMNTAISNALLPYKLQSDSITFTGYVTNASLNTRLLNFVTSATLSGYSTTSQTTTELAKKVNYTDSVGKFVTPTSMASYVWTHMGIYLDTNRIPFLAKKNTFSDTLITRSLIPATDNVDRIGTPLKQYTTAYLKTVPIVNGANMNDVVSIGSSSSAGVVGLLGILAVNRRVITMRDGTTFSVLVLP